MPTHMPHIGLFLNEVIPNRYIVKLIHELFIKNQDGP